MERGNVVAVGKGDGENFNIANGVANRDGGVVRGGRENLGNNGLETKDGGKRAGEIDRIYLDIAKARRVLGWEPTVSLDKGARETVRYFQEIAKKQKTGASQKKH